MNSALALALLLSSGPELRPLVPGAPQVFVGDTLAVEQNPDYLYPGYSAYRTIRVSLPRSKGIEVRAQVCADSESLKPDLVWASRALARIWELNYVHLGLDLPTSVEGQTLHLLLNSGGQPGGEQVLTRPPGNPSLYPWCIVHLYQVPTLDQPAERWREIAHEYGHAVLPAWGPYRGPEAYSNGDVGERLTTAWMYEALTTGQAEPADAAGASATDLLGYMQQKVWAESAAFAIAGPADLEGDGPSAFQAGVGFAAFCQQTLPHSLFRRALGLGGAESPQNLAEGVMEAVSEQSKVSLRVLPQLQGRAAWYPVGTLRPPTKPLARKKGWAKLIVSGNTLTLAR